MKKHFSKIALSLLLVCFTFLLASCIFEKDDFVEATAEQKSKLTTYLSNYAESEEKIKNYKIYTEMNTPAMVEYEIPEQKIEAFLLINENVESVLGFDVKIESKLNGVVVGEGYINDNILALKTIENETVTKVTKVRTTIPEDYMTGEYQESIGDFDAIFETNPESIISQILATENQEGVTVKYLIDETDNQTRYKIECYADLGDTTILGSEYILTFTNEELVKIEMNIDFMMQAKYIIEKTDKTIEFPSFEDYEEIEFEEYLASQNESAS